MPASYTADTPGCVAGTIQSYTVACSWWPLTPVVWVPDCHSTIKVWSDQAHRCTGTWVTADGGITLGDDLEDKLVAVLADQSCARTNISHCKIVNLKGAVERFTADDIQP